MERQMDSNSDYSADPRILQIINVMETKLVRNLQNSNKSPLLPAGRNEKKKSGNQNLLFGKSAKNTFKI